MANSDLAWRVMDAINEHRASFNMATWVDRGIMISLPHKEWVDPITLDELTNECGTTACFAGWTVLLTGHKIDRDSGNVLDENGHLTIKEVTDLAYELLDLDPAE